MPQRLVILVSIHLAMGYPLQVFASGVAQILSYLRGAKEFLRPRRTGQTPVADMQRGMASRWAQQCRPSGGSHGTPASRSMTALPALKTAHLRLSILWAGLLCAVEVHAAFEEPVNTVALPRRCSDPVKIAVIGGGISGAATTTFLNKLAAQSDELYQAGGAAVDAGRFLCGSPLHTDLYEAGDHLGGRLDHVNVAGGHIEFGGETIDSSNKYMKELIQMYNSDPDESTRGYTFKETHTSPSETIRFYYQRFVYNGEVLPTWAVVFLTMLRAVAASTVRAWKKIYNLFENSARTPPSCCRFLRGSQPAQRGYPTFDSGLALVDALGISSNLYSRFSTLVQRWVPPPGRALVEFIVIAVYTQTSELQSLAGLLSLVCAFGKALDSDPPRRLVVEYLIRKFADRVYLNCKIDKIVQHVGSSPRGTHKFTLESDSCEVPTSERWRSREYDYVVVATPLSRALRIFRQAESGELTEVSTSYYEYQKVFVTAVQAERIRKDAQLVQEDSTVVTTAAHSGFLGTFLVSQCGVIPGNTQHPLVTCKLKSGRRLTDADLARLFEDVRLAESREWNAYPFLYPFSHTVTPDSPTYLPAATKFELAPGLYYVNSFEGVFSCMEGQAVAARNVAQLLLNSVGSHTDETQEQSFLWTE